MRYSIKFGLLALAVLLAAPGCHGGGGGTAADAQGSAPRATLENTLWKLVALGGEPAKAGSGGREISFTLATEGSRVRGSTGCNRMMGGYTLAGEKIGFTQLATTRMACANPDGQRLEAAFLKSLEEAAQWRIQGETLELSDNQGKKLARFESLYLR